MEKWADIMSPEWEQTGHFLQNTDAPERACCKMVEHCSIDVDTKVRGIS